jgi:hypothetical protein
MTTIACDGAGAGTANCGLTLDKWMKAITSRVAGAPAALMRCELEAALHDFYHRSTAWREVVGPLQVTANQQYLWLNPIDLYADMQHIFGVHMIINGCRIDLQPLHTRYPGEMPAGDPRAFFCAEPYTLELFPTPKTTLGKVLYVEGAMAPIAGTERLPEVAASHHFDGILSGALYRLYAMPQKPWSNPALAIAHEREFRRRIFVARDQATRGHSGLDTPMWFPKWA